LLLDDEIIRRAIKGDKSDFKTIFNTYKLKVYGTAYLILKDKQNAEDAVQEIFLQVHLQIHKLANTKAFEVWLYRITVNTCYSLIKKLKRFDTIPMDEEIENMIPTGDVDFHIPDDIVLRKEMKNLFLESIYSLPVKGRTALILFYFDNLSIKEIAKIENCSENTVKSRLLYGKKVFKDRLMKDHREVVDYIYGGGVCES